MFRNLPLLPYAQTIFTSRNTIQTIDMTYISVRGVNAHTIEIRPWPALDLYKVPYLLHKKHTTTTITSPNIQSEQFHHISKDLFNQYSSTSLAQKATTDYSPALEESLPFGLSESLAKQN